MTDCVGSSVIFDPEALQRTVRRVYADDHFDATFTSGIPSSNVNGRSLRELVQFAVAQREADLESELLTASLYQHTASILLELCPRQHDPARRRATPQALLNGYRKAARYMDDYASLPITMGDVVEAAAFPSNSSTRRSAGIPRREGTRATISAAPV